MTFNHDDDDDDHISTYAFYLPQFHPVPENNKWWGEGFTEWNNVAKAKPRFRGHRQPQLPEKLGFYDLRLDETRRDQAKLAAENGVDGFIYYHYWFNGRRILELPVESLMRSDIDFPFALCWANENWTRAWDGLEREVLIEQSYCVSDHLEHCELLCSMFRDRRYIKVEGKPLFIVYRPEKVEFFLEFATTLRLLSKKNGFEDVYLLGVNSGAGFPGKCLSFIDGVVDFQPASRDLVGTSGLGTHILDLVRSYVPSRMYQFLKVSSRAYKKYDYRKIVSKKVAQLEDSKDDLFPCVFPSWDNSARRSTAVIIQNDHPEAFRAWVRACVQVLKRRRRGSRILFINAWNEWAEGCHLEPDQEMGRSFLLSLRDGKV